LQWSLGDWAATARLLKTLSRTRDATRPEGVVNPPHAVWLPTNAGGSSRPRRNGAGH